MKHILLCGERHSGKTYLTERLLRECRVPLYGFMTKIMVTREDGYHEIYMFPAGKTDGAMTEENHVGNCNTRQRTVNLQVFDNLGVRLLREARSDGIIVMDELGFMESGSPAFCQAVLERLDGDIPVLATVKAGGVDVEFLRRVRSHPKAELYMLCPERLEELYNTLLPVIQGWNEVLRC